MLLEACACAHSSIKIMTPYFLPGSDLVMALELAALRGVRVDIIVPQKSDHRFVDCAMRAHIGPLLDHGVRFWSGPPPFNHSKLMVVDKHWCLVGSANWDMRSLRLNFELNVEVYSEDLAHELDGFMLTTRRSGCAAESSTREACQCGCAMPHSGYCCPISRHRSARLARTAREAHRDGPMIRLLSRQDPRVAA